MKNGVWFWLQNQTITTLENIIIMTQVPAPSSTQDKGHAYHLFRPRRYCAPWIYFTRPNCKPALLLRITKKSPLCSSPQKTKKMAVWNVVNSSHNTPRHSAQLEQQFFANHHTPQPHQSPYSPDMALCDVFLFHQINIWEGKCFEDAKMINFMWISNF